MEILLKGNYKSFTKVLVEKSNEKTSTVLINLHGLYGLSGDPRSKSKKLAKEVTKKGIAHVLNFNSSRDWKVYEDGNWGAMKEAYKGKVYEQELQDAVDTMEMLLNQSKVLFNIDKKDLRLILVGNSLGGVTATCLSDYFRYTDKIIIAGSGLRTVMDSNINEKEIIKRASKFKGDVLLLQGSKDDTVPLESGSALLAGYKNARKTKVVLKGANHQFSKINGKNKKKAYQLYTDEILRFIK